MWGEDRHLKTPMAVWLFPVATTLVWTRPYMDQTIPDLSSPGQTQDIDRPH
jgi:hypothetical protein